MCCEMCLRSFSERMRPPSLCTKCDSDPQSAATTTMVALRGVVHVRMGLGSVRVGAQRALLGDFGGTMSERGGRGATALRRHSGGGHWRVRHGLSQSSSFAPFVHHRHSLLSSAAAAELRCLLLDACRISAAA